MSGSVSPYVTASSAMTLGAMITQFEAILNRDDCTDTLSQTFMQQAMLRIEREARLPCMERLYSVTPTSYLSAINIPADFLAPIDLYVQSASADCWMPPYLDTSSVPGVGLTWTPLKHYSYRQLLAIPTTDIPRGYARMQAQFVISGWVPANVQVQLLYYGAFTPLANEAASNELTASCPDLAIYAALSLAADYFQHESGPQWEARYQQILAQITGVSNDIEFNGGPLVVAPSHGVEWW